MTINRIVLPNGFLTFSTLFKEFYDAVNNKSNHNIYNVSQQ